ncbi:hypothetical protein [Shouchella lonarensis]|uniref:Uncharacterized protein n=1 Tax=Shouchella lonarensis TaxID=1464122 RepID=A0A1G6IXS0_9BACI|nr:hypothetical protein [Shouchella lonarensis]SDC11269.1 hypothetical protein SAMN05421737_105196 [Shouchella lonarensis]
MKRYRWLIGVAASIVIIIMGFIIQVEHGPDEDARVIVDFTLKRYSAPDCFDDAGFTNNIGETTYKDAVAKDFKEESVCTSLAFKKTSGPLWFSWFISE